MDIKDSIYRVTTRAKTCKESSFIQEVCKSMLSDLMDELYILRNINGQNTMSFKEDSVQYTSIEDR